MGERPPDPPLPALLDLLRCHHEAGLLLDLLGIGARDDDDDPLADALEAWADAGYPGASDDE